MTLEDLIALVEPDTDVVLSMQSFGKPLNQPKDGSQMLFVTAVDRAGWTRFLGAFRRDTC